MLKRLLILFLLFVGLRITSSGQGFNSMSGRNHPELDWQVAETEHFRIMYPARIAGIEEAADLKIKRSYGQV